MDLSEFEASLVYKVSSKTVTQRNSVSKNKTKQKKRQKQKERERESDS